MPENQPVIISSSELIAKYNLSEKIITYFQLLKNENRIHNLVSRETIKSGLADLAAESIYPLEHVPEQNYNNYLDIGSGGGFPSIPLILTERIKKASLVDRRQKKSGALRRMLLEMSFRVEIYTDSFEQIQFPQSFDLITMRLVKLNKTMLSKIMNLLNNNGIFIYYSVPEFDLDNSGLTHVTHCYATQSNSPLKSFTMLKK